MSNHSKKADIEVLDAALSRTFPLWSRGSCSLQDGFLHSSSDARGLRNHASLRGAKKPDAVDWQGHAEVSEARFDLKTKCWRR